MKRGKKIMAWVLGVVVLLIAGILIWFIVPYSPTKAEFARLTRIHQMLETQSQNGIFTNEDIAELPQPVQKYFQYCGYIGTLKMSNMYLHFNDVDFVLTPDRPKLKIKYTQYNFVDEPVRIAYIDTSLYGIPFEGIDAYRNGAGSMKGVIAKTFTLFDQRGEAMDRASLVTCLAESLLYPNFALQDYIKWEEIDETHAKATITYYGISASGIFTFNDEGAIISFITNDREYTDTKGNVQQVKWSAAFEDYEEVNGIKFPSALKAVWHFETGDLVYFDGRDITIKYDMPKLPVINETDKSEAEKYEVLESDRIPGWKKLNATVSISELTDHGSQPLNDKKWCGFSIQFPGSWTLNSSVLYNAENKKVAEIPPVVMLKIGQEAEFLEYKPVMDEELISHKVFNTKSGLGSKTITRISTESGSWYPHIYRLINENYGFTMVFYSGGLDAGDETLYDTIADTFSFEQ